MRPNKYSFLSVLVRSLNTMYAQTFFYKKLTFVNTGNSFHFSKLTFLTRNSLFLLETYFSNSKLTFLTRNSLFLLETYFSNSKLTSLAQNSLFLVEAHFFSTRKAVKTNTIKVYNNIKPTLAEIHI